MFIAHSQKISFCNNDFSTAVLQKDKGSIERTTKVNIEFCFEKSLCIVAFGFIHSFEQLVVLTLDMDMGL